jgi:membrane dipeptidase
MSEGIAASKVTPVISHSGCHALVDLPRNTRDEEMRALADKGGVFGVYLMPFIRAHGQPQREDFLAHVEHARKVCGEDHIGIGTDNPLFGYVIDDQARRVQREFYENRARQGIAAPGEAPDVLNLVEGYNDIGRYDRMATDLRQRGWTAIQVDKLLGNNFARVFDEVWG